jgi:superfamily II DNA or RNA helicase
MTNILRKNQIKAIDSSVSNDFESGVHFHATGSGKSWIAMTLIHLFNRQYPASNIMANEYYGFLSRLLLLYKRWFILF